jgi:hypothetical protein
MHFSFLGLSTKCHTLCGLKQQKFVLVLDSLEIEILKTWLEKQENLGMHAKTSKLIETGK